MMKWFMMVAVAAVLAMAPAAQAGCGGCGKDKAAKAEGCAKDKACDSWTAGLKLTADQEAKIKEIKAGCDGSKEACAKAKESIRGVLTAEQQKAFDEKCAAGGCGSKKSCCPTSGDKA